MIKQVTQPYGLSFLGQWTPHIENSSTQALCPGYPSTTLYVSSMAVRQCLMRPLTHAVPTLHSSHSFVHLYSSLSLPTEQLGFTFSGTISGPTRKSLAFLKGPEGYLDTSSTSRRHPPHGGASLCTSLTPYLSSTVKYCYRASWRPTSELNVQSIVLLLLRLHQPGVRISSST